MYICVCTCVCVCMYCMYICVCTVCTYVYVLYVHMCMYCMYICVCTVCTVCTYVYVCVYVCSAAVYSGIGTFCWVSLSSSSALSSWPCSRYTLLKFLRVEFTVGLCVCVFVSACACVYEGLTSVLE